jgi:predicted HAD superfamily hydrolase
MLIYSFDVFDTALIRIWAKPTDLFWELGNQLQQEGLIDISGEDWANLRINAEKQARKISLTGEVDLKQIYSILARSFKWSSTLIDQVIKKEIEIEFDSLRPVPEIQKRIREIRDSNATVIYLSDMYLPRDVIQDFLRENKIWDERDRLYVSSEIGVNKASGKLFELCLNQESLAASQLIHIGDNLHSDFKVPQKLGIQSQHFNQTNLNRYEKLVSEVTNIPRKFRSILAGTSRLTRLQSQEDTLDKQTIWNTSANVTAPVLFGFVYWCLEQAQQHGIKRLYFVARDGQILLKIARIIVKNWNYDIDCKYLYGSRQAWHFPAIQEIGEKELDWIFDPTFFLSVYSVCERVNLEPKEIKKYLVENGFSEATWNENLEKDKRLSLRELFLNAEICNLITTRAKEFRVNAIGYFLQEGLGDGVPFAMVDIGWNGRLQRSLSYLLAAEGIYPPEGIYGFYFGLAKRFKAYPQDQLLAYFYDIDKPSKRDYLCRHRALIELWVSADHGSAVKFEKKNHGYIPILRQEKNTLAIDWGLLTQQNAIEKWTENFVYNFNRKDCEVSYFIKISELLMQNFFDHPSFHEAKIFGGFNLAEDQTENILYELAPVYDFYDTISLLIWKRNKHHNVWLEASIKNSKVYNILLLKIAINLKKNIAKIFMAETHF